MKNQWKEPVIVLTSLIVLFSLIQFSFSTIPEYDGYYHIKMAEMMREDGIIKEFPWLQSTTWSKNFSDMHFLFHIMLIPFTVGNLVFGAKLAAVLFSTLTAFMLYILLKKTKTENPFLWTIFLFAASTPLLQRFSLLRAGQISIFILFLAYFFMINKKHWHLLVTAATYAMTYTAFPLIIILSAIYSGVRSLKEKKIHYKPVLFSTAGIAAGLLLNPYFPKNLQMFYVQIVKIAFDSGKVVLGNEWQPYDFPFLLSSCLILLIMFTIATAIPYFLKKRQDTNTITMFFMAVFFLYMTLKSKRYVEYLVPFTTLFCAYSFNPLWKILRKNQKEWLKTTIWIAIIIFGAMNINSVIDDMETTSNLHNYKECADWLKENSRTGEIVFNADWDDFPGLFFYNTKNLYSTGMDPSFTYLLKKELWWDYQNIITGKYKKPYDKIKKDFNASYVFTDTQHGQFICNVKKDPRFLEKYKNKHCIIYEMTT